MSEYGGLERIVVNSKYVWLPEIAVVNRLVYNIIVYSLIFYETEYFIKLKELLCHIVVKCIETGLEWVNCKKTITITIWQLQISSNDLKTDTIM